MRPASSLKMPTNIKPIALAINSPRAMRPAGDTDRGWRAKPRVNTRYNTPPAKTPALNGVGVGPTPNALSP